MASMPSNLRLICEREGLEHHNVSMESVNFVQDSCERVLARSMRLTGSIERLPDSVLQSACLISHFCSVPQLINWLAQPSTTLELVDRAKADEAMLKHWGRAWMNTWMSKLLLKGTSSLPRSLYRCN
mmetsp:Transcript_15190/g.62206  ORF Transcript_15190/g.62206 Transcript_15190/m.62206 type:complete len:127 (-) Transcript_15190:286-666(-)